MVKFFIFCLCLVVIKQGNAETSTTVKEVEPGNFVELPCLSNDDMHRFMFWQLKDERYIIGPGNPLDEDKYNYEEPTGKLYIREVSIDESGIYRCISIGIENNATINVHIVELIVKNDLQESGRNMFESYVLRSMALSIIAVVGISIIIAIILLKRRRGQENFFDILEESRENSPEKCVGNFHSPSEAPILKTPTFGGFDNIDYPKVFQQIQRK